MELGLFDEASEKLTRAMKVAGDPAVSSLSANCLGICLLSMARRDSRDGKAGAAFSHLQRGIESCRQLGRHLGCVQKLLGDLYSFGALLPPEIFAEDTVSDPDERTVAQEERMVRQQLAFVAEGKTAYKAAEDSIQGSSDEELLVLRASAACDVGSNLLLQAQIVSFWHNRGIDEVAPPEAEQLLEQAEHEFRRSIEICPAYAPAWCGLGCAVHKFDPILAQHAFCRSVQLDPLLPDPYANLGFLYTRCGAVQASASVSMALTQVADTPMMWINRALLLERQEEEDQQESAGSPPSAPTDGSLHRFEQAADAYRAALQVAPLPSAKLGLALTCRRRLQPPTAAAPAARSPASLDDDPVSRTESHCLLREYLDATGRLDVASRVFGGVAACEGGAVSSPRVSDALLARGRGDVLAGLERLEGFAAEEDEDRRDGDLDLESVRALLSSLPPAPDAACNEASQSPRRASTGTSLLVGPGAAVDRAKRRICLEPDRGDLWLALAKELVRSVPEDRGASGGGGDECAGAAAAATLLRSARAAARKSCELLDGQSRDPALRRRDRRPPRRRGPPPPAREVSDSLALRGWLDSLPGAAGAAPAAKAAAMADAQRALLLCPDNPVAREVLLAARPGGVVIS
jgi:tetratricopeptide (TPR) repeat protein